MDDLAVVVLAAGLGKRMGLNIPKVLHKINNLALIDFVVETWTSFNPIKTIVVVGYEHQMVENHLKDRYSLEFALQEEQLGTAHATQMALPLLDSFSGNVAVACGDVPFITQKTITALLKLHKETEAKATVLTAFFDDPSGYGRIVRGDDDQVLRIVEDKDSSPAQKQINEINSGTYIFSKTDLTDTIVKVGSDNKQGEFYLTDVVKFLQAREERISAYVVEDNREVMGINSPEDLKEAQRYYNTIYKFCQ